MINYKSREDIYILTEVFKSNLLHCTIKYPSGDNCQPFRMHFEHNQLKIYYDHRLGKHELNYQERSSLISYGCIKRIIDIVCSHYDLLPQFDEYMYDDHKAQLWANVSFKQAKRSPHPLLDEIHKRTTNRGEYEYLDEYSAKNIEKNLSENFKLVRITKSQAAVISDNDKFMWTNTHAIKDLLRLTHFFQKKDYGFNFENLYTSPLDWPALLTLKLFPFLGPLFWPIIKNKMANIVTTSCVLLYLKDCKETKDYIIMGEECYENWLLMTKLGYSLQPISTSSLCLNDLVDKKDPKRMNSALNRKQEMKTIFEVQKNIAWSFRIGRPKKQNLKTRRITQEEFTDLSRFSSPD